MSGSGPAGLSERLRVRLPRLRVPRPAGFPWSAPTWPGSVPMPPPERHTGVDYDTEWSRRYGVRLARAVLVESLARPFVHAVVPPTVEGADRLEELEGPLVFAANHNSHLDTALFLSALPRRYRHRLVVAAAADYFFDNRWKAALSSFALAAVPIERTRISRRSADLPAELLADGWSVLIYPEGGRSPDGWAQPFQGGAAYLAIKTGAPIVPVHISGTDVALPRGARRLQPTRTTVTFGRAVLPEPGENARRVAARLEAEVAALADERRTDWWQARRRAASGDTPPLSGPEVGGWRRSWARPAPKGPLRVPEDRSAWARRNRY
ncbi:MAG TPA: lysophospholipid acyltransferase family protein [Acidimicrobiales bacterium]|nr:lysophospholipid acyltransferase family protein [Acidimicrobiales bacterium]